MEGESNDNKYPLLEKRESKERLSLSGKKVADLGAQGAGAPGTGENVENFHIYDDIELNVSVFLDDDVEEGGMPMPEQITAPQPGKAFMNSDKIQNKTYRPHQIPPDWEMAEDHLKATSIGVPVKAPKGQAINVDEMSGRPVDIEKLPICSSGNDLNFLGPAYPMYFQFLYFSMGLLVLMFAGRGAYGIYSNSEGTFCKDSDQFETTNSSTCVLSSSTQLSLANKRWDDTDSPADIQKMTDYNHYQRIFNLVSYILVLAFFHLFRYRQRVTAKVCDDRDTSISDYTFMIKNIPKIPGADMRKEIWKFIENNALPGQKLEVRKVVCCYDVVDKLKLENEVHELVHQKVKLVQRGQKGELVDNELQYVEKTLSDARLALRQMRKAYIKGEAGEFLGIAFVTVNTQQQYWDVLNKWKQAFLQRWRSSREEPEMKMEGKTLKIQEAPEPSDVFWENLGVKHSVRVRNSIIVDLACFLILLVCFGGVFGIYDIKAKLISDLQKAHTGKVSSLGVQGISYFASFVIVIINYVLQYLIRKLVFFEKNASWTEYYTSVAEKLAWAQFLNTSIITFAVAWFTNNYWGPGGMIESIIFVFQMNAFYTPIYNLVNIWYWLRVYNRSKAKREGDQSKLTQSEAMLLFEHPQVDFATSYSGIIKSLFSAAFYAPVVPIVLVWTLLGIFLCYWVDKYNILRKSSIGKALGVEIALQMTEVLEWYLIIFGVANFLFDWLFFKQISVLTYIMLGIAVVNAVFPMDWLNVKIFGEVAPDVFPETYDECKPYLDEEYDRFNPATKEVAIAKYTKMMQEGDTEKHVDKFLKKNKLN